MSVSNVSNRGFTLLEVLIAITLLGFITLGVVSVTDNAVNTKDRTHEANLNNLAIEGALARFEWDFGQIYSPLYFSTVLNMQSATSNPYANDQLDSGANGGTNTGNTNSSASAVAPVNPQLQMYYESIIERMQVNERYKSLSKEGLPIPKFYAPEKNIFEFLTVSNRRKIENVRQSQFAWVRYGLTDMTPEQLKDQEDNKLEGVEIPKNLKNLTRWFDPNDPWGTKHIDIETIKGNVLLENVEVLEFSFWDFQRKKWETNLRTIQNGEGLIRGVKMYITWYDSAGIKRSMERIFRNHWPVVVPQDQGGSDVPQGGTVGGQNGTTNNGNNSGNNSGSTQNGNTT